MRRVNLVLLSAAVVGVLGASSFGVIRHPNSYELSSPTNPTGPDTAWFAKFGINASAVAVGPHQILTTRHQTGGASAVGVNITFPTGGNAGTYSVVSETVLGTNVDLRVLTINETLLSWAPLYGDTSSAIIGKTSVFGGYGGTRGTTNFLNGSSTAIVGYNVVWDPTSAAFEVNKQPLLFGQQRIDSLSTVSTQHPDFPAYLLNTPLLMSDFDGPDNYSLPASPAPTDKVPYEAGIAEGDSGGGWFIDDAGTWKLAGLSLYNDNRGTFGSTEGTIFGQPMGTVDIRSFAPTITAMIPEPTSLALIGLGGLALLRRRR